jgi:hypothetical protein
MPTIIPRKIYDTCPTMRQNNHHHAMPHHKLHIVSVENKCNNEDTISITTSLNENAMTQLKRLTDHRMSAQILGD